MAFHKYGKTVSFPRDEDVDIHVRQVTLNADDIEERQEHVLEIREWIKSGEVYGHGIVLPRRTSRDLLNALERIEHEELVTQ